MANTYVKEESVIYLGYDEFAQIQMQNALYNSNMLINIGDTLAVDITNPMGVICPYVIRIGESMGLGEDGIYNVSVNEPIGMAVLRSRVGEEVAYNTKDGLFKVKIYSKVVDIEEDIMIKK